MQVALMVPCYIDLFYPEVGVASLELLEKLNVDVVYPFDQTCCAQPMANSGCYEEARATKSCSSRTSRRSMSGPSGSADIAGATVHPAQGVMTLTVIFWPSTKN